MSKIKMLDLPRVYTNPNGNYPQHKGKPYISYSAYTSHREEGYRGEGFANYFLGIRSEGNIFTSYGSDCGKYFETGSERGELSDFDVSVIASIDRPAESIYEREIVIDRGTYIIVGYIDIEFKDKGLVIQDLKTGSISSKAAFYESQEYQQTTLYSHARMLEGEEIQYSGVILLDRKGNGQEAHPMRLTGDVLLIKTPYSKERAEKLLESMDKTTLEIAEYYRVFKKYLL